MVAKINRGVSLYGAVIYNQSKVNGNTARIIFGNRMITDLTGNPERVTQQTMMAFENYLLANKRTEKPILHISLNPSPEDHLSDEQFASLAKDYMEKMGYGNQPFIVYKHEDIDRHHIHIVSTCVDESGNKIKDSYEWRRSMEVCRELEELYGLKQVTNHKQEEDRPYLKKVNYQEGDLKRQISNTLKSAINYRFQSFGEYSVLLTCFNIEAKTVKGEDRNGKNYNGIIYSVTDDKGNVVSNPFKSSLFGKSTGYESLSKRMKKNTDDFKNHKFSPQIKSVVSATMKTAQLKDDFIQALQPKGIDVLFRENEQGRIYGVTFIDHNRKEIYNGSRLGKDFSANVFHNLFNVLPGEPLSQNRHETKETFGEDSLHVLFDNKENAIEQAFGLFEVHGEDYTEVAFTRRIKRKKKCGPRL